LWTRKQASGVARVASALGKEIFLRLLPTKTTKFEVKNRCGRSKNKTVTVANACIARNELDEVVIVGESNNARVWWPNGGFGADPPTLRRFFTVFPRNTHF